MKRKELQNKKCIICGKDFFINEKETISSYLKRKYCCSECRNKGRAINVNNNFKDKEFIKNKVFEKYGVYNVSSLDSMKKLKHNLYYNKSKEEREEINNKIKKTLFNKTEEEKERINNKIKETKLKKYGRENNSQLYLTQEQLDFLDKDEEDIYNWLKDNDIKTGIEVSKKLGLYNIEGFYQKLQSRGKLTERIKKLLNGTINSYEKELQDFLKELNINFNIHNKSVISPLELDIYIPSKNIAIEFNGIYWHCINNIKDIKYHFNKYKLCQEKGIDLIQIWEDQWINKKEIIKSILKHRLGLSDNKIYARQCEIKEVNNEDYRIFCEKEHIQGYRPAKVKLGLYYQNKLIQIASFNKCYINGKCEKYEYEWVRGCISSNNSVIGGTSKLLNYFIKTYHPKSILCFSDNNLFNGKGYKECGFELIDEIKVNKFYVDKHNFNRISRNPFDYKKLKEDSNLLTCYGCGSKKFVYYFK